MNTSRKSSDTCAQPGWTMAFWSTLEPPNSKSANLRCPRPVTGIRRNSRKGGGQPREATDDERRSLVSQPPFSLISFAFFSFFSAMEGRNKWIRSAAKNERGRQEAAVEKSKPLV